MLHGRVSTAIIYTRHIAHTLLNAPDGRESSQTSSLTSRHASRGVCKGGGGGKVLLAYSGLLHSNLIFGGCSAGHPGCRAFGGRIASFPGKE